MVAALVAVFAAVLAAGFVAAARPATTVFGRVAPRGAGVAFSAAGCDVARLRAELVDRVDVRLLVVVPAAAAFVAAARGVAGAFFAGVAGVRGVAGALAVVAGALAGVARVFAVVACALAGVARVFAVVARGFVVAGWRRFTGAFLAGAAGFVAAAGTMAPTSVADSLVGGVLQSRIASRPSVTMYDSSSRSAARNVAMARSSSTLRSVGRIASHSWSMMVNGLSRSAFLPASCCSARLSSPCCCLDTCTCSGAASSAASRLVSFAETLR